MANKQKPLNDLKAGKPYTFIKGMKSSLNEKKVARIETEKSNLASSVFQESVETAGHARMIDQHLGALTIKKKAVADDQDEKEEDEIAPELDAKLRESFEKGDKVKIKNVKKYDSMAKEGPVSGEVMFVWDSGPQKGHVAVKITGPTGSGQSNVDPEDLIKEDTERTFTITNKKTKKKVEVTAASKSEAFLAYWDSHGKGEFPVGDDFKDTYMVEALTEAMSAEDHYKFLKKWSKGKPIVKVGDSSFHSAGKWMTKIPPEMIDALVDAKLATYNNGTLTLTKK